MRNLKHWKNAEQIHLSGSLWREPQDSAKAGKLCWIHRDYAELVRHPCNTENFRVPCGIHPSVWQHLQVISASHYSEQWSNWTFVTLQRTCKKPQLLWFGQGLSSNQDTVLVMQCMPRNKNLCAVIQSHNHNLKFASSKNHGKKSQIMSGKLVIPTPSRNTLTDFQR